MIARITPSTISGKVQAPGSKSLMQRACAAALLAKGRSTIINPSLNNDDEAALDIIQKLGAVVEFLEDGNIAITSEGVQPKEGAIHCGESGLSSRMFTPIAALSPSALTITGEGSLVTRPMDFFEQVLPQLNVECTSSGGKLPLHIKGPLQPTNIEIDGSLSSQFLTGLLMAFGAAVTEPVTITVKELTSKPYIDLTLQVMESFGRKITHDDYEKFHFQPQEVNYTPQQFSIEGDWSGAAFLLVAGAIAGDIEVTGLDVFSSQADKAILQVLMDSGCRLSVREDVIEVGPAPLKPFHFNAIQCPDLFPPVAALAAFCNGKSVIEGTHRLTHKESNRAVAIQQELGKMGVEVELQGDLMIINGGGVVRGAQVYSHHDHRIAMACAVAGLRADGITEISAAESVNKSYKAVYDHLKSLGATVEVV
ncbi:3-phosphoshikimate 1-carboxyvinyltransferase [Aridibaculum aurantiacum]|uniref:3-phosphoshikimate 1-carboxyvinyltransferase n=1 Tax=Aridibaculum aurantiacum TaxID=2810307 RepID=UPI001A969826|nr:3-phosphoshikimate 1-carboxyvinyltransferase [Aridibaculum aurantiacum]